MAAADWSIMVEWTRHALINWLLCLKLDKSILSAFYVNMTFENRIESCVLLSEGLNGHLFPLISMFWSHEVHVIILYCLKISFILSFLGFVNNKITWQFDSPLTPHLLSSGVGGKHLYHEGVKFKAQAIQVLKLIGIKVFLTLVIAIKHLSKCAGHWAEMGQACCNNKEPIFNLIFKNKEESIMVPGMVFLICGSVKMFKLKLAMVTRQIKKGSLSYSSDPWKSIQ